MSRNDSSTAANMKILTVTLKKLLVQVPIIHHAGTSFVFTSQIDLNV